LASQPQPDDPGENEAEEVDKKSLHISPPVEALTSNIANYWEERKFSEDNGQVFN
jgi:hypothetical protein